MVPKKMVPKNVVPKKMVPKKMVPKKVVPKKVVLRKVVAKKVVPKKMVHKKMVPKKIVHKKMVPKKVALGSFHLIYLPLQTYKVVAESIISVLYKYKCSFNYTLITFPKFLRMSKLYSYETFPSELKVPEIER